MNQTHLANKTSQQPAIWAIGGADTLGVAADIRAAGANHVQCATIVSSISATTTNKIAATSVEMLKTQWRAIALGSSTNICKIGLLVNAEQVLWLANKLKDYRQTHPELVVIYEPVLASENGDLYINQATIDQIKQSLLPQVNLLIVKAVEMTCLTQLSISNPAQIIALGQQLSEQYQLNLLLETLDEQQHQTNHYYFSLGASLSAAQLLSTTERLPAENGLVMVTAWRNSPRLPAQLCTISSVFASLLANNYRDVDAMILTLGVMAQLAYQPHPLGNERDNVFALSPASSFNDLPLCYNFDQFVQWSADNQASESLTANTAFNASLPTTAMPTTVLSKPFAPCATHLGLYMVVDSLQWLEKLLKRGVKTVQLAVNSRDHQQTEQQIIWAVALGQQYQARVIIAEHWQFAVKHQAYGVILSLAQSQSADLAMINTAGLRLGISTTGIEQALRALKLGPSFLALANIGYNTGYDADNNSALDPELTTQAIEQLTLQAQLFKHRCPLVAMITTSLEQVTSVKAAGVAAVALSSHQLDPQTYHQQIGDLLAKIDRTDPDN